MPLDPARTVAELKELRQLTGNEDGAQRVAWTDTWETARGWLREKVAGLPLEEEIDEAGNQWWTLRGASERAVLIGGHIDSVPNGGWLDGALNVVAGVEVVRRLAENGEPAATVRLVDWADEEGARFGRSLFGSSAAAGSSRSPTCLVSPAPSPFPSAISERRNRSRTRCSDSFCANFITIGSPSTRGSGTLPAGTPARFAGTVSTSAAYMRRGSCARSPRRNARMGIVGAISTSHAASAERSYFSLADYRPADAPLLILPYRATPSAPRVGYNPLTKETVSEALIGTFVPGSGNQYNGMVIRNDRIMNTPRISAAPRIGFAWDPLGDGKQAIRVFSFGRSPCRSAAVWVEGAFDKVKRGGSTSSTTR